MCHCSNSFVFYFSDSVATEDGGTVIKYFKIQRPHIGMVFLLSSSHSASISIKWFHIFDLI